MEYEYFKTVQLIMNRGFFSSNKMKYPLHDLIDYHILKIKYCIWKLEDKRFMFSCFYVLSKLKTCISMKIKMCIQSMIINLLKILTCNLHSNYH